MYAHSRTSPKQTDIDNNFDDLKKQQEQTKQTKKKTNTTTKKHNTPQTKKQPTHPNSLYNKSFLKNSQSFYFVTQMDHAGN